VVLIAGRGNLRELLALRRPTSWWRAGLSGVLVVVGTGLLLVLLPFLQTSEEQGLEVGWDPDRALPFVLNAAIIVLVSPIIEELTYRGLGFTLLERFGQGWAIALTGLTFALSHASERARRRARSALREGRSLRSGRGSRPRRQETVRASSHQ